MSATGRASRGCRCPGPSHANLPCDDRPSDAAFGHTVLPRRNNRRPSALALATAWLRATDSRTPERTSDILRSERRACSLKSVPLPILARGVEHPAPLQPQVRHTAEARTPAVRNRLARFHNNTCCCLLLLSGSLRPKCGAGMEGNRVNLL